MQMSWSLLPGGIGKQIDRLRGEDTPPILTELHVSIGQGLALTPRHLIVARSGVFSIDLGSR